MAKFLEALQQAGRPAGTSIGFFGRRTAAKSLPVSVLLQLEAGNNEIIAEAGKSGVTSVAIKPNKSKSGKDSLSAKISEIRSAGIAVVGIDYTGSADLSAETLPDAKNSGADFVIFNANAPVALLNSKVEGIDKVLVLEEPQDELWMLFMRGYNALNVDAVILKASWDAKKLGSMTVSDSVRYRIMAEILRFPLALPAAISFNESELRTIVGFGTHGIVLDLGGGSATLDQLKNFLGALEHIPRGLEEEVPSIAHLAGSASKKEVAAPDEP